MSFLDSGALKIALRPWFAGDGHLEVASGLGFVGRKLEGFLDRIVGLQLLRDMSEFFRAFEPLFAGFRERAEKVRDLLGRPSTRFVLVTGPGERPIPDALYFARRLGEAGYHLGPVVVNRLHLRVEQAASSGPVVEDPTPNLGAPVDGHLLFRWLGERHHEAFAELRRRLTPGHPLIALPVTPGEPTDLAALAALGEDFQSRLRSASATSDKAV